jgi:glutathione peroxidase-family protein
MNCLWWFVQGDGVEGYEFGGDIKWNFEAFLVSAEGQVVHRFAVDDDIVSAEAMAIIDKAVAKE